MPAACPRYVVGQTALTGTRPRIAEAGSVGHDIVGQEAGSGGLPNPAVVQTHLGEPSTHMHEQASAATAGNEPSAANISVTNKATRFVFPFMRGDLLYKCLCSAYCVFLRTTLVAWRDQTVTSVTNRPWSCKGL